MAAKPADPETLWSQAVDNFEAYRFEEASAAAEQYLEHPRHSKQREARCRQIIDISARAAEMMQRVEDVTILDSTKLPRARMLEAYALPRDVARLTMDASGCVTFTTGRGDKSFVARNTGRGLDLFRRYDNGEGERLSDQVNTADHENYPFELADGVTLYFGSDGHGSIGGYDIFMTRYNNETFDYARPINVGMPFNSIYNDYMLAIDELQGVGWFATDRYQSGDTVVIYKFRVEETKRIIPAEFEPELRAASAQLKRYTVGHERRAKTQNKALSPEISEMHFVVNDTLIYTSVTQFRDSAARRLYEQNIEADKAMKLRSVIVEGKRREYLYTDNADDKAALRREILEDEEYLLSTEQQIKRNIAEIRKLEIKAL